MIDLIAPCVIPAQSHIGEAPVWDPLEQRLVWVDHAEGVIHEVRDVGGAWRETRRWDYGGHVCAALPDAAGGLVVAGADAVVRMAADGGRTPMAKLELPPGVRLNEVKADPHGRLWGGCARR